MGCGDKSDWGAWDLKVTGGGGIGVKVIPIHPK